MKELSIEQKARRYDEAKIRISKAYNDNRCTIGFMNEIFPELKEDEDCEIMNAIKEAVITLSDSPLKNKCLTWLEKQGKQILVDKVEPKFKVGDVMRTLQEAKDGLTDGIPVAVSIDDENYRCNNEIIPIADQKDYEYPPMNRKQNPAWSEEDERKSLEIKCLIGNYRTGNDEYELCSWIDKLKDRVQPKQEWSEDTQQWIDAIIKDYEGWYDADIDHRATIQAKINILKSLRPQSHWRPSDEQLDSLYDVLNPCDGFNREVLESLYVQLKKLREE